MSKSINWWTRKFHRWGALLVAIPLIIVIVSGLLLQVKKQFAWVQPPTVHGSLEVPHLSWTQILEQAITVPPAAVKSWQDIERLDIRIAGGVTKVQCKNGWELQLDSASGKILSSAYRRSDLIESIHDGSFFFELAKLWIFLPSGVVLLALWFTGIYLWYLPIGKMRKKNRAKNVV